MTSLINYLVKGPHVKIFVEIDGLVIRSPVKIFVKTHDLVKGSNVNIYGEMNGLVT